MNVLSKTWSNEILCYCRIYLFIYFLMKVSKSLFPAFLNSTSTHGKHVAGSIKLHNHALKKIVILYCEP